MKCKSLCDALTIAYSRPFSGNDRKNKKPIPDLSKNILKNLENQDKELHQSIIDHRNKAVAHSDSELINMEPFFLMIEKQKIPILIPLRNKTKFTFSSETINQIKELCAKLMGEINRKTNSLAEELNNFIPIKKIRRRHIRFSFYLKV